MTQIGDKLEAAKDALRQTTITGREYARRGEPPTGMWGEAWTLLNEAKVLADPAPAPIPTPTGTTLSLGDGGEPLRQGMATKGGWVPQAGDPTHITWDTKILLPGEPTIACRLDVADPPLYSGQRAQLIKGDVGIVEGAKYRWTFVFATNPEYRPQDSSWPEWNILVTFGEEPPSLPVQNLDLAVAHHKPDGTPWPDGPHLVVHSDGGDPADGVWQQHRARWYSSRPFVPGKTYTAVFDVLHSVNGSVAVQVDDEQIVPQTSRPTLWIGGHGSIRLQNYRPVPPFKTNPGSPNVVYYSAPRREG